jgi:phosphomannomutase
VHLFRDDVPTPLVAFGVRHLKCAAGVMVTASHNPKEDNGYKVYWANSAQITAPHDAQIARAIEANFSIWDRMPDDKAIDEHPLCLDPTTDVCAAYLAAARHWSFRTPQQNAAAQLRVVYTAMHGVGGQSVERIFDAFGLPPVIAVREQHDPDPDFTTVEFPNPEEANGCSLRLAMATADREGAPLILANDPDADRLAVAERQRDSGEWRILDGNEIALLLADWLWRNYTERHPEVDRAKIVMLNSTVSSKALAAMAAKEGFHYRETLTGFKWLGNLADELVRAGYTFLFAYEVEIGFMIGDMSLDTDGVRAAPVFVEMANHLYERGLTLSDHLDNLYHKVTTPSSLFALRSSFFALFVNQP